MSDESTEMQPVSQNDGSLSFRHVFEAEKEWLKDARVRRDMPRRQRPLDKDLVGLAFSGGGIRSATFNLGVIQALASRKLLKSMDYLSTVSGGGYIGSWLSSWAYHVSKGLGDNQNHLSEIEDKLNAGPRNIGDIAEPHEIYFLRKYSNYLTPQLGALSGDTLAFVGTYLRNLLLNQLILISLLLALLLVPSVLAMVLWQYSGECSLYVSAALAFVFLVMVIVGVVVNTDSNPYTSQNVFWLIALPQFCFSFLLTYILWQLTYGHNCEWLVGLLGSRTTELLFVTACALLYAGIWLIAVLAGTVTRCPKIKLSISYLLLAPVLWAMPAGALAGIVVLIVSNWMVAHQSSIWGVLAYDVPFMTLLVLLIGVIHLGLIGRAYEDALREWWARLGGVLLAIAFFWSVVCVLAFFFPLWIHQLWHFIIYGGWRPVWKVLTGLGIGSTVLSWIATAAAGFWAAKSSKTGPRSTSDSKYDLLARLAPPLTVSAMLVVFSIAVYWALPAIFRDNATQCKQPFHLEEALRFWLIGGQWRQALATCLGLYAISRFVGYRVDVNEFSLHNAYRNRLVRCYLGATHRERKPQPFTGFDETDNVFLHELVKVGAPFHILNATLNVVKGKELALQSRKARSFIFTPLYSGFDFTQEHSVSNMPGSMAIEGAKTETRDSEVFKSPAYRPTNTCSRRSRYKGVRLGTAMAISGAAVSPSMGYYTTSGAVSFLLTIFSVRLGWWLGNPRNRKSWESGHPRSSWRALTNELTGATNEDQKEVYLSDGGHFENLAIYELIRRRCRVIIACDASADPSCACNDLASAIEKCRVDFHTDIEIDLENIRPSIALLPGGERIRVSKTPFTSGKIHYPDDTIGTLIYIKPSLLETELPQDVLAYARIAQQFPHQSTADQFFDEAQFESYRALGSACAEAALNKISEVLAA